ncbi:hypothetical protein [Streptomyces silvensis]|uniref:CopG family transcriptional regulator n=1 Tax=Streptomyces silvensis TaxID=1765722 RepID=A0A0W7X3A5_9ACTN|nr:hypothetical protein [Streptomyces silvensis]KUF17342.1 hypothetical protein AT728_16170 [Streptomyces silvensis]
MTEAKTPPKAKTAITLPQEVLDQLRARETAGEIPSVSGHIQKLLQREQEAAEVDAVLERLFPGERPGPEHLKWAAQALGAADESAQGTAA